MSPIADAVAQAFRRRGIKPAKHRYPDQQCRASGVRAVPQNRCGIVAAHDGSESRRHISLHPSGARRYAASGMGTHRECRQRRGAGRATVTSLHIAPRSTRVIGLTRALALEVATKGVTVNAVCPGYTETDMVAQAVATIVAKTKRTAEEARAELSATIRRSGWCSRKKSPTRWLGCACRAAKRSPGRRSRSLVER